MAKVYVDLMSQPSRAVYMFLKYTKVPHTIQSVALRKGEHLTPEFASVNPFKRVPAMVDDDGFHLSESVAIVQYLCKKHNIEDLYPSDLKQKARIDAFNHWQHMNLRMGGSGLFQNLLIKVLSGKTVQPEELDMAAKIMKASLNKMENVFLKDTPYLWSDKLSIADFFGVCELMQPQLGLSMDVTKDFPKVAAWSELVKKSIGTELFDDAHKFISLTGPKFVKMQIPTPKL